MPTSCPTGRWKCDARCLRATQRCDGKPDCSDKTDEHMCELYTCGKDRWRCNNSVCIKRDARCDGVHNCGDHSDEQNCENYNCPADRWKCSINRCIRLHLRCDGKDDCEDNSDEQNCGKAMIQCPGYIMEKEDLRCICSARNVSSPFNVTWPGHSTNDMLSLNSAKRDANGTRYNCSVTADGVRAESSISLHVAYGPQEKQVNISPTHFVSNGTQTFNLTCTASGVYPTPYYVWGGMTCDNQFPECNCTFTPDPRAKDEKDVTCTAVSRAGGYRMVNAKTDINVPHRTASEKIRLSFSYPPSEGPVMETNVTSREHLRTGDGLTCTVTGGKPPVASVNFYCINPYHPDQEDARNGTRVASSITVKHAAENIQMGMMTCVCNATWSLQPEYYQLVSTHQFHVEFIPAGASGVRGDVLGVVAVLVVVVVAVIAWKRRHKCRRHTYYVEDPSSGEYDEIDDNSLSDQQIPVLLQREPLRNVSVPLLSGAEVPNCPLMQQEQIPLLPENLPARPLPHPPAVVGQVSLASERPLPVPGFGSDSPPTQLHGAGVPSTTITQEPTFCQRRQPQMPTTGHDLSADIQHNQLHHLPNPGPHITVLRVSEAGMRMHTVIPEEEESPCFQLPEAGVPLFSGQRFEQPEENESATSDSDAMCLPSQNAYEKPQRSSYDESYVYTPLETSFLDDEDLHLNILFGVLEETVPDDDNYLHLISDESPVEDNLYLHPVSDNHSNPPARQDDMYLHPVFASPCNPPPCQDDDDLYLRPISDSLSNSSTHQDMDLDPVFGSPSIPSPYQDDDGLYLRPISDNPSNSTSNQYDMYLHPVFESPSIPSPYQDDDGLYLRPISDNPSNSTSSQYDMYLHPVFESPSIPTPCQDDDDLYLRPTLVDCQSYSPEHDDDYLTPVLDNSNVSARRGALPLPTIFEHPEGDIIEDI
ncbi:hypothetical protein V1264_015179 [Littorina saxatilis]